MPESRGTSSQFLDETLNLAAGETSALDWSGNNASTQACINYLKLMKKDCGFQNTTYSKTECEKQCGKLSQLYFNFLSHISLELLRIHVLSSVLDNFFGS